MRIYIDSNIIANWFVYVTTKKRKILKETSPSVYYCYKLVEIALEGKPPNSFVTSSWAICEAMSVIRTTLIQFRIALDGLNVRDRALQKHPRYALTQTQIKEVKRAWDIFLEKYEKKEKKIEICESGIPFNQIYDIFIYRKIEPDDYFHIIIAKLCNCSHFVTLDMDLLSYLKNNVKKYNLNVYRPEDMLKELN